jgi:hypothetical protein
MTATGVQFDGTDLAAAIVAIDSLSIDGNDRILEWHIGNQVTVIKIPVA